MESGRYAEAAELFRAVIALDPRAGPAHFLLGGAYARLGRFEEARASFNLAMEYATNERQRQAVEKELSALPLDMQMVARQRVDGELKRKWFKEKDHWKRETYSALQFRFSDNYEKLEVVVRNYKNDAFLDERAFPVRNVSVQGWHLTYLDGHLETAVFIGDGGVSRCVVHDGVPCYWHRDAESRSGKWSFYKREGW